MEALLAQRGKRINSTRISQAPGERVSGELRATDPAMLRAALAAIPNANLPFDDWLGMLYATKGALADEGLDAFRDWSARSSKHDEAFTVEQWTKAQPRARGAGSVFWLAAQHGWKRPVGPGDLRLEDFHAFMPTGAYLFAPAAALWPAASVDTRVQPWPIVDGEAAKPSRWLDQHRPIEQMTWAPGLPMLIEIGWFPRAAGSSAPGCQLSSTSIARQCAFRARRRSRPLGRPCRVALPRRRRAHRSLARPPGAAPRQKINHALVLGGRQGIGKDTLFEPVKRAVGAWNFAEPSPQQLLGRFNGFVKSVILRVNEARDLGDIDRYQFYEHLKVYHRRPARRAARRREEPARIQRDECLRRRHHDQPQGQRDLSAGRRPPPLRRMVPPHQERLRPRLLG